MVDSIKTDPRLEGLPAGGRGTASAEEMTRRFPEMFNGLSTQDVARALSSPGPSQQSEEKQYGQQSGQFVPPGNRPPEGARPTDYSIEGRRKFENIILNKIGGNPFDIDPYTYVEQVNEKLPDIFNRVFRGQVVWSDRDKMNKDQSKFWNEVVKGVHAQIFNRVENKKKMMIDQYNFAMNRFDNEAKEKAAALAKVREAVPPARELVNEKGVTTLHERNPQTGKWEDTGMKTVAKKPGEVPEVVTKALSLIERAAKAIDPGLSFQLQNNPKLANEPWFKDALQKKADPRWSALLERQFEIAQTFYGTGPWGDVTAGNEELTGAVAGSGYGMGGVPHEGAGLTNEELAGKTPVKATPPPTATKSKRIKMDKDGNIIQ